MHNTGDTQYKCQCPQHIKSTKTILCPPMELTLINACKSGDRKSQKQLYEKYKVSMYVLCLRYCSVAEEAKDVLQEGFIKIFRDIHQYDESRGKFDYWMKRVFVNTCLESLRKKKKEWTSLEDAVNVPSEEPNTISVLSLQELTLLIQKLPIGYRTVFNLYVIEGYSHAEIAEKLGITESTSKTQLMKAKSLLRQKLEESLC